MKKKKKKETNNQGYTDTNSEVMAESCKFSMVV